MLIRSFLFKLPHFMKSSRVAFVISLFFSINSVDLMAMTKNRSFHPVHAQYAKRKETNSTPGPLFGDSNAKPGPLFGDRMSVLQALEKKIGADKIRKHGPLFGDALVPVIGGGVATLRNARVH